MQSEIASIKRLLSVKSKVSCHYLINRKGEIMRMVKDNHVAWHAGKSSWKKYESLNNYSIGIEISNPGHGHGYKKFNSNQISSLIKLLKYLKKKYNIKAENILGHSDIAPDRKKDPGEKFPWWKLVNENLCKGHNLSNRAMIKKRNLKVSLLEKKIFFSNLYKIGYSEMSKIKKRSHNVNLTKAFQRKYRQNLINGKIDQECFLISENLIKT